MQALDKKLFRDFKRLWVQGVAIAMVLACGVALLVGFRLTFMRFFSDHSIKDKTSV